MKIALIDVDKFGYECSMSSIARELLRRDQEVVAFYRDETPPNNPEMSHRNCDWCNFDLEPLEEFNPDRVVMFNGSHAWRHGATRYIAQRWRTVYMEHGWLPQRDFFYIDPVATGGRSAIAKARLKPGSDERVAETVKKLKDYYKYRPLPVGFPKDYVLVPLQLNGDTSVMLDSPYIKTMSTLMGFIRKHFPDIPILLKRHPLDRSNHDNCGAIEARPDVRFNDLVQNARAIIGINSTTLIEALIHGKPIATLGYNVASNKGVYLEPDEAFQNPRKILEWKPDERTVHQTLDMLYHEQFPKTHPGLAAIHKILA